MEEGEQESGGIGRSKDRVVSRLYAVLCHSCMDCRETHTAGGREPGADSHTHACDTGIRFVITLRVKTLETAVRSTSVSHVTQAATLSPGTA